MRLAKTSIVLALSVFSTLAAAGYTSPDPIVVNPSEGYAFGSLSGARYSSSPVEYLFCDQYSTGNIACVARDANGVSVRCSTTTAGNPSFAETMRAMNGASFVSIRWDPATSVCTSILVRNGSNYLP